MPRKSESKCYFGCVVDGPLHRFPKWDYPYEEKFNSWKAVLNYFTQQKGNEYIYNNVKFCYRHFKECYQLPSNRLTGNAIPTLNLKTNTQHQPKIQATPVEVPSPSQQMRSSSQELIQAMPESSIEKKSAHVYASARSLDIR